MFFNQNIGENICVNVYDVEGWSELWYDQWNANDLNFYGVSGYRKDKFKNNNKYQFCKSVGTGGASQLLFAMNNILLCEYIQIQYNNKKIIYANLNAGYVDSYCLDSHQNGLFSCIRRGTYIFNTFVGSYTHGNGYYYMSPYTDSRSYVKSTRKYLIPYNRLTNRLLSWISMKPYGYFYCSEYGGENDNISIPGIGTYHFSNIAY
jgi:hypothetical protein